MFVNPAAPWKSEIFTLKSVAGFATTSCAARASSWMQAAVAVIFSKRRWASCLLPERSAVFFGVCYVTSAGRTRTYNQPVNSRLLYH